MDFSRLWSFLLLGAIGMFSAEVLAGSSLIWFVDGWSLLVTFFLYLSHILFYYNLAIRTKRHSLLHLYLWGMLFGLYEAPITKVLWVGYSSEGAILGLVGGVAIFEFVSLILFWHPILSFIVPVSIFQVLTDKKSLRTPMYIDSFLSLAPWKKVFAGIFFVSLSSFSFVSSKFDSVTQFIATAGSVAIIFGIFHFKKRMIKEDLLILDNRGFSILIGYLVVLYSLATVFISPELLPSNYIPYTLLLLFGILVLLIIKVVPPLPFRKSRTDVLTLRRTIMSWVLIFIGVPIIFSVSPPIATTLLLIILLLIPLIGIYLSIRLILRIPKLRS